MKPTTHVLPYHHRPNDPILLEDISITHVNGHSLSKPFQACVRLHLYPRISCRIESENLPKLLLENLLYEAFQITTTGGFKT